MSEATRPNYDTLLFALWSIRNSTEPGALKHNNYEHLEQSMFEVSDIALRSVGSEEPEFLRLLSQPNVDEGDGK